MFALAFGIVGAPAARAQSRLAAGGAGGAAETSSTGPSAVTPASSPADLDRRVEELEKELVELRMELASRKQAEETPAATPGVTLAQDKPADAKAPEKVSLAGLLGPTSISGFVDANYSYNTNHPASNNIDACAFNCRSKTISLNMIELILDKAPDPMGGLEGRTGYHFSVGYGETQSAINAAEKAASNQTVSAVNGAGALQPGFDQYVKEAYFSYLAPAGKGLQIDVGKFVTPMGAEVIESKDNWNYSRSLLFTYAIPLNHFGARAKYTFNDKYNLTGYFINGWNNLFDNNSGKTYGVSFGWNPDKKNTVTLNYLAGPELTTGSLGFSDAAGTIPVNVNDVWRQTIDLVYAYNPTSKLSLMANYDYGHGDRGVLAPGPPSVLTSPIYWTGGAGYVKYALDANDYVAGRYEYYSDRYGFSVFGPIGGTGINGGIPHNHVQEFTLTYQRTIASHLLTRLEYRRDNSPAPIFELSNFGLSQGAKSQNVLTLGMIFLFDSREAK
jgi:hypothetical protein